MAFIGLVVAIIGACVAWFDKTVSVPHLFVIVFIVLALVCGHLAYRGHQSGGWW
jgi:type III secretory pathway component EscS